MPVSIPAHITSFQINMSDAALQRPMLAMEASRLFAWWANVEFAVGSMASILIGDQAALALLDQIRNKNQQMDGISAAIAARIGHDETRDLLKPVFALVNRASKPRNQLAHCLWGTIEQIPDGLLLTNPNAAVKATRLISQSQGNRHTKDRDPKAFLFEHEANFDAPQATEVIRLLRDGTEVWKQSDFDGPRTLLHRAVIALAQYTAIAAADPSSAEAERLRRRLSEFLDETRQRY